MIEFYIDTRVDLKTMFPHRPPTLRTLTLQGILVLFISLLNTQSIKTFIIIFDYKIITLVFNKLYLKFYKVL